MPKNIVVCCDGTGNEFRESQHNTNVVKLFEVIVKDPARQIAYYDPGVGTMSLPGFATWAGKWISIGLGLAFGYGITRNIEDAYSYLMARHEAGDRLYIFGFSRGAFTARALAGMLHVCGLLEKGSDNLIPYASKIYMRARQEPQVAADFRKTFSRECKPHFIGVWDTVESVGIVPGFRRKFPDTRLNEDVLFGRHALALDEQRSQFRPNLWTEPAARGQSIVQVWFSGVHADVGGSYAEAGLSNIALRWMLGAAAGQGLLVNAAAAAPYAGDHRGRLHNPLLPAWWLLGWWRRRVPGGALVHQSVPDRQRDVPGYTPPNLPAGVTIVGDHGPSGGA
jgi:uncharacterized protein (DUF2235 family)